ncbi:MAG TPA: tetratricopeptide repeat protein [Telluria sp.]|nr:tetratricopeptide repeat protein [Telluria sp.]
MKTWATLCSLLYSLLLAGCASVGLPPPPPTAPLFADGAFGPASETVGAADLFTLSPEMRAYLHSPAFARELRTKGAERGLVDALYKKGELKLEYDTSATRNAAQTFAAHAGNCLSLVIMTAAFARELDMVVEFQSVLVEENWSRHGDIYFASTHVNLTFGKRATDTSRGNESGRNMITIDFLPPEDTAGYRSYPLEEGAIVAMYLNNRAAEALANNRMDDAYWWARAAVLQDRSLVMGYNTLGVIYHKHGDMAQAERVYRAALVREPENIVVMRNLVPVLEALGKTEESKQLERHVSSIEPFPPFHFFNLGITAMRAGDYKAAKALFSREVRRAPYYHEFHFWLAVAMLRLGETNQAREQVVLAIDTSTTRDARDLYSAKLAAMRMKSGDRFGAQ